MSQSSSSRSDPERGLLILGGVAVALFALVIGVVLFASPEVVVAGSAWDADTITQTDTAFAALPIPGDIPGDIVLGITAVPSPSLPTSTAALPPQVPSTSTPVASTPAQVLPAQVPSTSTPVASTPAQVLPPQVPSTSTPIASTPAQAAPRPTSIPAPAAPAPVAPTPIPFVPPPTVAPAQAPAIQGSPVARSGPPAVISQIPGSAWRWLDAYNWNVEWRQGPGPGRLSEARYATNTIVIWHDSSLPSTVWAGAFAHELGHAVAYVHFSNQQRQDWNVARGLSSWPWVPGTPNDFSVGEGDFAEAFMSYLLGHQVRSVGGPLSQADRAWIAANTPF